MHQIGFLHLLAEFYTRTIIPPAVVDELERGRAIGVDLPDLRALPWVTIQVPEGLDRVTFACVYGSTRHATWFLIMLAATGSAQWRHFGEGPPAATPSSLARDMLARHNAVRARVGMPPLA